MFQTKYSHYLVDHYNYFEKLGLDFTYENKLSKLEIQFYIKSKSYFVKVFIAMLLLIEKKTHVRVKFLINRTIISKKRTIRIGCVAILSDVSLIRFLHEYFSNNLDRTMNVYNLSVNKKSTNIYYIIKKILFYNFFYYDNDVNFFYDIFDSSVYEILFVFTTINDIAVCNKVLMSSYGLHRISDLECQEFYYLPKITDKELDL